ncbi:MAG: nitrogenase iron-molybdenum cofactor biosynthesis protein NifN [Nitrospiraceae bacterium]|nr:nitrogenase iron-molybdenum cofactor biosynthesis protein NifN [Nitrospiraceae bacterium]
MFSGINRVFEAPGCEEAKGQNGKERLCRSRGGESCAFDGAMIVLQPIADCAHIVHGPSACCGNSWENRGSLSGRGSLHRMGFATGMDEFDIVYGSEGKLHTAIVETCEALRPRAAFVYSTCVSGLTGEDIDAVCRSAEDALRDRFPRMRVVPVNAPGFVGPKNLGNRLAGEALLTHVIGAGEPPFTTDFDINLMGEYNIAGDLAFVEPLLEETGLRVLSRITGNASFEEITFAHRAKLNVVVCGRALVNVAKEMKRKYGIPYVEVSFFGKTEVSGALRAIAGAFHHAPLARSAEDVIARGERELSRELKEYEFLKGKKAVLYTGGVKSWSFISALGDLGVETVAVGTKKSSFEDERKMKRLLGPGAPLYEDVTPKKLLALIREKNADMLVAGGRNQYLAVKEAIPFVDVNQERHVPYAGYKGLVNLARGLAGSMRFYGHQCPRHQCPGHQRRGRQSPPSPVTGKGAGKEARKAVINPIRHSQSVGAAIALQGVDGALPMIHGAQGCSFLAKVLLTRHFREPIALASTKLFTEDVVMGSERVLLDALNKSIGQKEQKAKVPQLLAVLSTGLTEIKGDDVKSVISGMPDDGVRRVIYVPTPDFEGGLETGYAKCVQEIVRFGAGMAGGRPLGPAIGRAGLSGGEVKRVNILADWHHTPADFNEIREMAESFDLRPVMVPDLSALDGSRMGISPLAAGGVTVEEIAAMGRAEFTIAIGLTMEGPARLLNDLTGVPYRCFEGLSTIGDVDAFLETLSALGAKPQRPRKYERQRRILVDGMRDAQAFFSGRKVCLALEPGHAVTVSKWLEEMGATVELAVIPQAAAFAGNKKIRAKEVLVGDFFSIEAAGDLNVDLIAASSHARQTAERLGIPLYETGFPVFGRIGHTARITAGYAGALASVNEAANLFGLKEAHS